MGLYPQPNQWQCGPFALKHALVTLGIFANENEISKFAGATWWEGTDEIQLSRAARRFNCDLQMVRRFDARSAKRELRAHLKRGIPCLLCIYEWSHWITVVKEAKGKFIVLDSKDDAVITIVDWAELESRWVYHPHNGEDVSLAQMIYDFHPVAPRIRVQTKAHFSPSRARFLRRPENRLLSRLWDEYLGDLLDICRPRTPLSTNVITMGEFFRRHGSMLVEEIGFWHRTIGRQRARRILRHFHFIADTYGLVIHEEDEKRAVAGISMLLALWAASACGVGDVYKVNGKE